MNPLCVLVALCFLNIGFVTPNINDKSTITNWHNDSTGATNASSVAGSSSLVQHGGHVPQLKHGFVLKNVAVSANRNTSSTETVDTSSSLPPSSASSSPPPSSAKTTKTDPPPPEPEPEPITPAHIETTEKATAKPPPSHPPTPPPTPAAKPPVTPQGFTMPKWALAIISIALILTGVAILVLVYVSIDEHGNLDCCKGKAPHEDGYTGHVAMKQVNKGKLDSSSPGTETSGLSQSESVKKEKDKAILTPDVTSSVGDGANPSFASEYEMRQISEIDNARGIAPGIGDYTRGPTEPEAT